MRSKTMILNMIFKIITRDSFCNLPHNFEEEII
jgi:hypothetical protein